MYTYYNVDMRIYNRTTQKWCIKYIPLMYKHEFKVQPKIFYIHVQECFRNKNVKKMYLQ